MAKGQRWLSCNRRRQTDEIMKDAFCKVLLLSIAFGVGTLTAQTTPPNCPNVHDSNGNNTIDIQDFLSLLGVFQDVDVDYDGIWDSEDDCIDTEACNYAANPTESCSYTDVLGICGGGCEGDGDGDGICDDVDTCVGELDECGVCNGPGPTEIVIEDIVTTYDSVYLPVDGEWFVFAIDVDTTYAFTCAPNCGDPVSYQGYDYETVLIGDQCWFAENLRNELYNNGDTIPSGLSDGDWAYTTSGAVAVYGEDAGCTNYSPDIDACDPAQSLDEYGRLYNWHAVVDARGLCPNGWHVPTDGEWTIMIDFLGGPLHAGGKMKMDYGWYEGGNGTNSSGFSALPGGSRTECDISENGFCGAGYNGYWWSSSPGIFPGDAYYQMISAALPWTNGSLTQEKYKGLSVRCIEDPE